MRLERRANISRVKHEEKSTDWVSYDGAEAHVDFMQFGEGTERTAYFRVVITWADVEAVLSTLADKQNENAMRIVRALRLADAVSDLRDDSSIK